MLIVVGVGSIVVSNLTFSRDQMKKALDDIERAFRFSINETILRGKIVRIKFDSTERPVKFSVEATEQVGLALPSFSGLIDDQQLSLKEQEKKQALLKKIDQQFEVIEEFKENAKQLPEDIRVLGVATDLLDNQFINSSINYVYFYPTGEKDNAFIILGNAQEIATIEFFPFIDRVQRKYIPLEEIPEDLEQIDDLLYDKAKEIYEKWLSQK